MGITRIEDIIKEMSSTISGYIACALVGLDGLNVASHAIPNATDPEAISAQLTSLLKVVDVSVEKMGVGIIEDNLVTTENAFILMRFLPGRQYYLSIAADRNAGNLGKLRMITKLYADRLSKEMLS